MSNLENQLGHVEPVTVHFDDLDAYGAVHHAKVPVLVERAVIAYLERLGFPMGHPDATAFVGQLVVSFTAPIAGAGPADVRVWVEELGASSLTHGFQISRGPVILAGGSRTLIKVDPATRRPVAWGDELRKAFAEEGLLRG